MPSGPHSNVTAALSELERKLAELERELGAEPAAAAPPPAAAPRPVPPPAPAPAPATDPAPPAVADAAAPEPRVDELREEIADLVRIRNQLESAARELVAEYDRLVGRLQELQPAAATEAVDAPPVAPAPASAPPAGQPTAAGAAEDARTFQGALVVDAGPFTDITTLTAFEQALAGVPDAKEVHVRGFEASRALVNIRLVRPVALVAWLRERLPLSIAVREATVGRLVLDVAAVDAPDAGASH